MSRLAKFLQMLQERHAQHAFVIDFRLFIVGSGVEPKAGGGGGGGGASLPLATAAFRRHRGYSS